MEENILIISSSEEFINDIEIKLKSIGYSNIKVLDNKEEAILKINKEQANIIILEQDLKETSTSTKITERNGENIAIKLMQDDIEVPIYFVGNQVEKYSDDNIIYKIDTTFVDAASRLEKIMIQERNKTKQKEDIDSNETIS